MKSIIMCHTPEECERIANGEQTVKVCKTAPKEAPFKVYIYQTKESKRRFLDHRFNSFFAGKSHYKDMGKVIGEFICDKVEQYEANERGWYIYPQDEVCMWTDEFAGYGKGKPLYGLHISKLEIYDEPRELGEFRKPCRFTCMEHSKTKGDCGTCGELQPITRPPQSWYYVEDN